MPSVVERIEEIEKRLKAATPGPWLWNVNLKHKSMQLESVAKGRWNETVMRFVRWGMQNARIEFCGMDGLMEDSLEYLEVVPGREHHKNWYQRLNHRDANLIANAPTDIAFLLTQIKEIKKFWSHVPLHQQEQIKTYFTNIEKGWEEYNKLNSHPDGER